MGQIVESRPYSISLFHTILFPRFYAVNAVIDTCVRKCIFSFNEQAVFTNVIVQSILNSDVSYSINYINTVCHLNFAQKMDNGGYTPDTGTPVYHSFI